MLRLDGFLKGWIDQILECMEEYYEQEKDSNLNEDVIQCDMQNIIPEPKR